MEYSNDFDFRQWHRHNFIKTFYLINKEAIFSMYEKINASKELAPKNWNNFVNSKELHYLIYDRIKMLIDPEMEEVIAYSEDFFNMGMEIHTDECEIYIAIPMILYDNIRFLDLKAGQMQIATRSFITTLCHMFFKDIYGKPFKILKEKDDIWVSLNEDYQYKKEQWP